MHRRAFIVDETWESEFTRPHSAAQDIIGLDDTYVHACVSQRQCGRETVQPATYDNRVRHRIANSHANGRVSCGAIRTNNLVVCAEAGSA